VSLRCRLASYAGITAARERIIVDGMIVIRWTGHEARTLRRALRYSVRDFASELGVGTRTVARWEAGGARLCPRPEMQAALDTALAQASPGAQARFRQMLQDGVEVGGEDATDRRRLLTGGLGASGLALFGSTEVSPAVAGADDDQLLMVLPAAYRRLERRLHTRLLVAPVVAHLGLIRQLLTDSERGDQRTRRLYGLLAETAGLAAWLYVDLDERASARRHYQVAIQAAERAGHPLLVAYMQASLGQFAAWVGDARQGLKVIEAARSRLKSAPGLALLWLDALQAAALAELGDQRALMLLDRAESRVDAAQEQELVWPWIFRFDAAKLAGYRAVAAGRLGRTQTAEAAYRLWDTSDPLPKQRALMDVERASACATEGDVTRACQLAVAAFDVGRRTGSDRVAHAVAQFRARLGSRAGRVVDELDDRLNSSYEATP
jgi:transcriptional regulator with XRE-family HTH domain